MREGHQVGQHLHPAGVQHVLDVALVQDQLADEEDQPVALGPVCALDVGDEEGQNSGLWGM